MYATWQSKDVVARRSAALIGIGPFGVGCALCATILLSGSCRPEPPNLAGCSRIEVQFAAGALDHFFPSDSIQEGVLSEEEMERVRSYDRWTMTDHEEIKTFADCISRAEYGGRQFGTADTEANVVCYQGNSRRASFTVHGRTIVTRTKITFTYPRTLLSLAYLHPKGIGYLRARWECALNLSRLLFGGLWPGGDRPPCPDPNHWCDVIVETMRRVHVVRGDLNGEKERAYPDHIIARKFTCPSTRSLADANTSHSIFGETQSTSRTPETWISDYAMNSHCGENSPEDMVFLFESQPGWNQHGGPERFTFDNHDPRGGLVLLYGGKVKFIRTEEELKQLRWK